MTLIRLWCVAPQTWGGGSVRTVGSPGRPRPAGGNVVPLRCGALEFLFAMNVGTALAMGGPAPPSPALSIWDVAVQVGAGQGQGQWPGPGKGPLLWVSMASLSLSRLGRGGGLQRRFWAFQPVHLSQDEALPST